MAGGVGVYFVVEGAREVVTAVGFDLSTSAFWGDRGEEVFYLIGGRDGRSACNVCN